MKSRIAFMATVVTAWASIAAGQTRTHRDRNHRRCRGDGG
jgi:hypothetical protein